MSRIGNNPIDIPEGVQVQVSDLNHVLVKGPLGSLEQAVDKAISLSVLPAEDGKKRARVVLQRSGDEKRERALHGLYRALLSNMITGVSKGHVKTLEVVGVGYRVAHQGQQLDLNLGFSHNILFDLPPEIKVETKTERGKNPTITLRSADKQLLGQVAAKIRGMRRPEPYKGKGIRYVDEVVRRKAGKAAVKQEQ